MSKFRFVFVAKDDNFKFTREFTEEYTAKHPETRFDYVSGNAQPLPAVYNFFLNEVDTKDYDYLVLMHADVKFDIDKFIEHVCSVEGKYDVIGLCGCAKLTVGRSPLNWFCGSIPFADSRWGCVTHGETGNQTSFFSQHHPKVTDHEVACIDGLCIVFSRKAIESGLRFDESIGPWDMYDTDISFQAVIKYGLKLGVIVRRDLMHYSVGKSITTQAFLETEARFRSKWNFQVPDNSPLKRMLDAKAVQAKV